jgi:hypothetical protein
VGERDATAHPAGYLDLNTIIYFARGLSGDSTILPAYARLYDDKQTSR